MIYTISKAQPHRTVEVEEIIYDDVNQIIEEKNSAGGKGMMYQGSSGLGGQSVALGFIGGYNDWNSKAGLLMKVSCAILPGLMMKTVLT